MHARAFSATYSSVRHHEPLPCLYTMTYHHSVSAAQALASLHSDVKRLREVEHFLQREIHRYRSSLEEVQTKLFTAINKANEMQNFLAPISRLPNEMLLAIFEEVVAFHDPGTEGRAEFTISKVSRRWRDLAIHSPRLWRRVSITPRVAPNMLEIYKTRGSRALDIEIWGWKDRRDFQRFDAALEKMLDTASRWRSLSIASVCDSHLSHLTLKLAHIGHFSGLKHFTFRASRPGQTCPVSFLMETATTTSTPAHAASQTALSPCTLKSLDAENFTLVGDLGSIHARATQNFGRLSSLTLRRYSNDTRSFRISIDFSAFRTMLSAIPNLTTLVLHGQPLRFRTDPVNSLPQGQGDGMQWSGAGGGGGICVATNAAISLPHLHTLVLHPGVLKPRYLQQTISAIHAPALRHFELVFPDSKISGQNVVERLFVDASPRAASSFVATTDEQVRRRHPRFPCVETLVLNNASSAGTALAFMHAFPCATRVTLGGVDVGSFPFVMRARAEASIGAGTTAGTGTGTGTSASMGVTARPTGPIGAMSRSGIALPALGPGTTVLPSTHTSSARPALWHRLDTLTLRQPRPDALRALLDWMHHESERGRRALPTLIVQGQGTLDGVRCFAQCARAYTRVELVGILDHPPHHHHHHHPTTAGVI